MEDKCIAEYLQPALDALKAGGVIAYPTDTVYGLGADATDRSAVELVRRIKGRDANTPILALVSDMDMLERYADVTPLARELAAHYLPGRLTLVLEARGDHLAPVAQSDGSVGFRIPAMPFCLALARAFDRPITSTSMNLSGVQQEPALSGMLSQLGDRADHISLVCDAGVLPPSEPSTIVDARGLRPVVLRKGAVPIHIPVSD